MTKKEPSIEEQNKVMDRIGGEYEELDKDLDNLRKLLIKNNVKRIKDFELRLSGKDGKVILEEARFMGD